jgi:hypothetical protein
MPEKPDVQELIRRLPCNVRLPGEWDDFFEQTGPMPKDYDDQRRFPRFYCRTEGALLCRPSLPSIPREQKCHRVYVKDISRSSVGFLHGEQLFPCEQLRVVLPDGVKRRVEVVRCRKLSEQCYDTAAKFTDAEPARPPLG